MQVPLKLFALARQIAGVSEVVLDLPQNATVGDLKRVLAETSPAIVPLLRNLMIAVNSEYAADDLVIPPGAEVAAIPPVSGGGPEFGTFS